MTSGAVPYTQANRMMAISTPLGEDALLLEHLAIDETINGLFTIEAQVKSQKDDLKSSDLIGLTVDFSLKLKEGGTRWWNGFVTSLHEGQFTSRGTRSYGLVVRPKVWTLSRTSDCRIFLNQTSVQIAEALCKEHGISDLETRITGQPPTREYSVQWNETDLCYMLRRLQQDGIFYWHDQAHGKHTLVLADHMSGYRDSQEKEVRYSEGSAEQDQITRWRRTFEFIPGKRAGRDWNFLTMQAPEGEQKTLDNVPGNAPQELYEFPGLFKDSTGAEQAMKYRIQATETGYETAEGASTVRTLGPAQKFTPQDVAKSDNRFDQQVVVAIRHVAVDRTYETNSGRPAYDNTFEAMPATTPATPHRTIPRPMITGTQIAMIAGPDGEEIFCDEFGRVKVWFPWDRRAKKDGSDTCWIRVGQPWAGSGWGYQTIPRVGMEALMCFREGNPDRPYVMGLVPDPSNWVPYPLPDNKTITVIKTKTYKGEGFNELHFDDLTDQEEIYCHAQRDMNIEIENDRNKSVGNDQSESVGNNKTVTVGADHQESIGGNMTLGVAGNVNSSVGQSLTEFVGASKETSVTVGQASFVGTDRSDMVGQKYQLSVGEVFEIDVGKQLIINVGSARLQMDSTGLITLDASQSSIVKGAQTQLTVGPGPVLYKPSLVPGGNSPPASCLREMAAQSAPMVG